MGQRQPVARPQIRQSTHGDEAGVGKLDFWIDRGGTFTDVVGGGRTAADAHKLLSKIRRLMPMPPSKAFATAGLSGRADPGRTGRRGEMGTTVATNALLERKGDRTLLMITKVSATR